MSSEEMAERTYLEERLLALKAPAKCEQTMLGYLMAIYRLCGFKHALQTVKGWGTIG